MSEPLPNLLSFVSSESEQFLISLANDTLELEFVGRLQTLFEVALPDVEVPEDDIPTFQLLTFTHYYFLLATSMLMRCHLSEAFGCARIAIDATLIGAHLIVNRSDRARLRFLPPHSPDFNPIELAFAKLKRFCGRRDRAASTRSSTWSRSRCSSSHHANASTSCGIAAPA